MSSRLEIGLALLLAGAIGIAVWAANRTAKPPAYDRRASTYLSGPQGSKAVHEVLVRLGRRVERRRTPLFTLTDDTARRRAPALLVILDPPQALQEAELEQVAAFVNGGGAVLAAGDGGGITRCVGWRRAPDGMLDDSIAVRPPREYGALRLPRAARVLAPRREPREGGKRRLEQLVKQAAADPCAALDVHGRDTLLAAVDGRPVVLRLRYQGGGHIILASDAGWFTNRVWKETDAAAVVLPLLTPARGPPSGRVAWDEYHQGFGRTRPSLAGATWEWVRSTPAGWAILQLVAVALVWLGMTAVRFGPARPVIERRRRSPLEHLEALAAGLESAAAADTAVQRIVAGLRRRLSRTGRAGPGSGGRGHFGSEPLKSWLDGLESIMRGPRGRHAVRRLQLLVTGAGAAPARERVLAAAQAVEDVWEELRPRTTRDGS